MALLKGKLLQERINWFEDWKSKKDDYLGVVISKIPSLDFSAKSLNYLEEYLLDKYDNPLDVYYNEEKLFLDSVCIYIGEVYRRNISLNIKWDVNIDCSDENEGMYNFHCYLTSYKEFIGFNPFSKIPFALRKRTGDKLYSHLSHNINLFKKSDEEIQSSKKIPKHNGCQYNHFLFIEKHSLSVKELNRKLIDYYKLKGRKFNIQLFGDSHLVLTLEEKYNFHFSFESGEDVWLEAKELGIITGIKIDTRLEFWGDEDRDGNYLNEHLFILEKLESEKIKIYNISQGFFI